MDKWGQEIRFHFQTNDSSTLTDALVTRSTSMQVISEQLYCVIYQNIHKWDKGIYFRGLKP